MVFFPPSLPDADLTLPERSLSFFFLRVLNGFPFHSSSFLSLPLRALRSLRTPLDMIGLAMVKPFP